MNRWPLGTFAKVDSKMWIKEPNKLKRSDYQTVNFLFKSDNFYFMDNHLCAAWCWLQEIDPQNRFNLFHIDQHYDCIEFSNAVKKQVVDKGIDLQKLSFDEFHGLTIDPTKDDKLFRFDNYIGNLLTPYPDLFDEAYFATHKMDTDGIDIKTYEPMIIGLNDNISYWINSGQWIFNLDIDYFFKETNAEKYQFLSDTYIDILIKDFEKCIEFIDVVTIALSPSFCGGWDKSYRIAKKISDYFDLGFLLSELE